MKTTAWRTASRSGLTPSSGGIRGKTAAPSGTGLSASSAISASGHRGNDAQFIAVLDCRGQVIEVTDVLIVQVDVDEAANLATLEDPLLDAGKLTAQIVERCLHRGAARVHCCLPVGMLPHRCGNMNTYGHDASVRCSSFVARCSLFVVSCSNEQRTPNNYHQPALPCAL